MDLLVQSRDPYATAEYLLKQLATWWNRVTPKTRLDLAGRARTSVDYLRKVVSGAKRLDVDLAVRLEKASRGELDRRQLCETCRSCKWAK